MAKDLLPIERECRSVCNRVGLAMLTFEALFWGVSYAIAFLTMFLQFLPFSPTVLTVIGEICYGLLYAAIFLLPIFFFKLFSGKRRVVPAYRSMNLPRETVLYLFAGLAVISAMAQINSMLVSVFSSSVEGMVQTVPATNAELVMMVFTVAVVPAFVEEALFRGLVLSNLQPYGKTVAVLGSALLFGLMHQNVAQLFYATAAGLVLGYIYVKLGSIWPCVLLHFVNNFLSVIQTVVLERVPTQRASLLLGVMQLFILVLGAVALILLILRHQDGRRRLLAEGCFEREGSAEPFDAPVGISFANGVKCFFSAPTLIFVLICGASMALSTILSFLLIL